MSVDSTTSGGGWSIPTGPFVVGPIAPVPLVVPATPAIAAEPTTAPKLATKPVSSRYQSLDIWRGAACLMLLLYHATFYAEYSFRIGDPATWTLGSVPLYVIHKLWVGVPIFFVISGYCIAASIESSRRRPHSLKDYILRRVRRIYPPLWAACGLAVLFALVAGTVPLVQSEWKQLPNMAGYSAWNWFGNFLAVEAWQHNLSGTGPDYLMPNTWTLCYEEQFYLVAGLLLACCARRFFLASAVVTVGVLVLRHALRFAGWECNGFFWDGHWLPFAAGILVYHALNLAAPRHRKYTYLALGAAALYGLADVVLVDGRFQKHLSEYVCVAAVFAAALMGMRRWDAHFMRSPLAQPLLWCGKRSYSIYLTHYPVVTLTAALLAHYGLRSDLAVAFVVTPLCLLISLPFAWLFYEQVERRFTNAPSEAKAASV